MHRPFILLLTSLVVALPARADDFGPFENIGTTDAATAAAAPAAGDGGANPFTPEALAAVRAASTSALANGPIVVNGDMHLIVMEYEAFYGPGAVFPPAEIGSPTLTTPNMGAVGRLGYDSTDPGVIAQHVAWMNQMQVDVVTVDQTNAAVCTFTSDPGRFCVGTDQNYYWNIRAQNVNLYEAYKNTGVTLKIMPLLDSQDKDLFVADSDGASIMQKQMAFFDAIISAYPNQQIIYQGKPLVMFYLGTPANLTFMQNTQNLLNATGYANKWTARFFTGYTDAQSNLWSGGGLAGLHQMNPAYQLWTFIDRFKPAAGIVGTYTKQGNAVESMTVTLAHPGNANWYDAGSRSLRGNGETLNQMVGVAKQLRPTFLFVNQFNEYATPDEGDAGDLNNNIEPTAQNGGSMIAIAADILGSYKNSVGGLAVSSATVGAAANSAAGAGYFQLPNGPVNYSNGKGHYCGYPNEASFLEAGGTWEAVRGLANLEPGLVNDGICNVPIRPGFFRIGQTATVYDAKGDGTYCGFTTEAQFKKAGGDLNDVRSLDGFPPGNRSLGICGQ